jgi:hypothetical protein
MEDANPPIMRFCGNCGKELVSNAAFCAYCGAPIAKVQDFSSHQADIQYIVTKPVEERPRRSFLTNFRGALVTPREEMPQISSSPNYLQPFLLNLIIGLITAFALLIFYSKFDIKFSESFLDSMVPFGMGTGDASIEELKDFYRYLLPISSIFAILLNWIIMSIILWILNAILASDLPSEIRRFKKMATIAGWAQIPLIFTQIITMLFYLFSPGGEVIYNSIWEREIISSVSIDVISPIIVIAAIIWSVALIYYAIKSLESAKSNPLVICLIYGILYFFLFPTVI